jgi:hypothetical protein
MGIKKFDISWLKNQNPGLPASSRKRSLGDSLTAMFHGKEFETDDETYTFTQDSLS